MPTTREEFFSTASTWHEPKQLSSRKYACGFCEQNVASDKGYFTDGGRPGLQLIALACPYCHALTLFGKDNVQMPAPLAGHSVDNLQGLVGPVYEEARAALSAGAPTGGELALEVIEANDEHAAARIIELAHHVLRVLATEGNSGGAVAQ